MQVYINNMITKHTAEYHACDLVMSQYERIYIISNSINNLHKIPIHIIETLIVSQ